MIHTMNWAVTDLWNCNLCAEYSVAARNNFGSASGSMTWTELYNFSKLTDSAKTLYSETSFSSFDYTLTLNQCDTGEMYWT